MRRLRTCLIVGAIVVAGLLATQAFARSPRAPQGPGVPPAGPPPIEGIIAHAEELGLDESTVEALAVLAESERSESEALLADLEAAHEDLRALLDAETPDEAAILQQAELIGSVETDLRKTQLRSMLQLRALLSPEQRERLKELAPPPPPAVPTAP